MDLKPPYGYLLGILLLVLSPLPSACDQARPSQEQALRQQVSALEEAWSKDDDPSHLIDLFETELAKLPSSAEAEQVPWADSYWPDKKGGLSWRWQLPTNAGRLTKDALPTKEGLLGYTNKQLAQLSPAEKYDILLGDYEYPLTLSELSRTKSARLDWEGLCHGWAAASYQFKEPDAVEMTNPDGIVLPFASSDVKALLAYAQQSSELTKSNRFLGLRCNAGPGRRSEVRNDPACKGVNAGSLHVILANILGTIKKPFIMDISRGPEVWNMPIYGYRMRVINDAFEPYASAAEGTEKIIEVENTVSYVYIVDPQLRAIGTGSIGQLREVAYHYTLELDGAGKIIGGRWRNTESPDFLWTQTPVVFSGFFAKLEELYKKASGQE